MKIAHNKKGANSFRMRNKLNGKPGINQNVNNKAQQQGKNSLNTAANKPKKFDGNNDAKTINTMLKKHVNDIDLSSDEDLETSESDCEVEDKINKNEKVKMQISNEASESEAEVDASNSEEEDGEGVNSNSIETSSEEVQQHNRDDKNQNAVSCIEDSNASNERAARTVCVRKLPLSIKEIHLRQFFSRYGKIVEISIEVTSMPHKQESVADILFEHEEDAEKSLETRGMEYKGNYLVIYKRNHRLKNEDKSYAVCVSWRKGKSVDTGLFLHEMESFGIVKYLHFVRQSSCAFVYFESVESVELALAAERITFGTLILYIRRVYENGFKKRMQHIQHQEYRGIRKKRPAKQPMHHKQYQTNLEPSIQIHKNKFDDSVTISFNKSGY